MKYTVSMSKSKRKRPTKRRRKHSLNNYSRIRRYSSKNSSRRRRKKSPLSGLAKGFKKKKFKKVIYIALGIGFFLGCMGLIGVGIYLKSLQNALPSPDELVQRTSDQSTQIFDRNETLLYTVYGDQNREFISIDDIPEHTKWAVLAAEDIEFYQHKGVDYTGIVMAALQNLRSGEIVRGASTVTQQLVKNTILFDVLGEKAYEEKYSRKIKEVLITMQVEQTLTKDEILQMYMNEIALGGVNYGFQAAANAYFGKDVQDLSIAESALIAGLIQSPGTYSPLFGTNPDLAKVRQEWVLDQMYKHRNLTGVTKEEIEEAKSEELAYKTRRIDIKAPHFVFYVKQLLEEEFGVDRVERGGLKVTTTLDYSIQEIAEDELVKGIEERAKRFNVNNGAVVVMDPNTGEILSMVGSIDYWNIDDPKVDGNVNITTSTRQVGSSAKPYTYLTAFSQGYGPWTLAPDIRMSFGNYKPDNWNKSFEGLGTARRNLGRSRNIPAVYTLQLGGIDNLLQTTEKLGITTLRNKADYGLALALGAGEMKLLEHTAAFGVFANEGARNDTISILKVEDAQGNVLKEKEETSPVQVIDEKQIYLLNYILCDLGGYGDRIGTANSRISGSNVCFKTGTTDGPRDLSTVMYHKNLVVGVWAGNNDNTETPGAWGVTIPLPIAYAITSRLADRYKVELFTRPSGVLSTTVCTDTGAVPGEGVDCRKEATIYISGRAPQKDEREVIKVCSENSLVPSNLDLAKKYDLLENRILMSFQLENTLQRATYEKYLTKGDDSKYIFSLPESGVCPLPLGPDDAPVIELSSPSDGSTFKQSDTMEITGSVRYLESVSEFIVTVDGNIVADTTLTDDSFTISYPLSPLTIDSHTLTVTVKDNYDKIGVVTIDFTVEEDEEISIVIPPDKNPKKKST